MKQKKSLGQVFLKDKKCIERIVSSLDAAGETVLEIGPGIGNVSEYIIPEVKNFIGIEIDSRFCKALKEKFSQYSNVEVINADILKFSLFKIKQRVIVFGNVPYQISLDIIEYLISYRRQIKRAYLTFQKEFADKLLAKPSSDSYGVVSCRMQYYAKVKKIFDIPAESFYPRPKVNSSFVELEFYKKFPFKTKNEKFLFELITKAFAQRRKKIINSLATEKPNNLFSSLKINPNLRAENLSLAEYVAIANRFSVLGQK